jgi:hypothetical protein
MLFDDLHADAGSGKKQASHHSGRAAANDQYVMGLFHPLTS